MGTKIFNKEDLPLLKRVLKYALLYKIKFIIVFLCILSAIGTSLALPLFWGKIIDSLFQKDLYNVIKYVIYSLVFGLLANIITYIQSYVFAVLNQNIIFDLKKDMYKAILNLPVKTYDDIENGELMSRLHGDSNEVATAITGTLLNSIVDIIRLIAIGVMVFTISIRLALIVLAAFPVSYFIFNRFGKKIRAANTQFSPINDKYFSDSGQTIWGIREVKCLGIKDNKFNSFIRLANQIKQMLVSITRLNAKAQALSGSVNIVTQMAVVLAGGLLVVNGSLSIQYFIAFYSYSGQFSGSLLNISRLNLNIQQVMNSLERIFLLMDGLSYPHENFGEMRIDNINGNIKFENVSFSYDNEIEVLEDISIIIPEKKKTAIVGSSGSGKSTICNLLLKLYDTSQGSIFIDNMNINEIREDDLRRHISVVRQEPILFNMTIKENLLLVNSSATQAEIENACRRAYIHEFIESLPNKYASAIGENGLNLSCGQKQRLAIARVLLKKSKIILFDEATSSLDNESQLYIKKAIDELSLECTVIIIAHRLSTIIEADNIYVMEKGKVVGYGKHHSLINKNNIYRKLYKAEVDLITHQSR